MALVSPDRACCSGGMMKLHTDTEVAELLGLTVDELRRRCRDRGWPCVRPKRSVWLFTDEQIEQIVVMLSTKPKRATAARTTRLPGQTARSAARSS